VFAHVVAKFFQFGPLGNTILFFERLSQPGKRAECSKCDVLSNGFWVRVCIRRDVRRLAWSSNDSY